MKPARHSILWKENRVPTETRRAEHLRKLHPRKRIHLDTSLRNYRNKTASFAALLLSAVTAITTISETLEAHEIPNDVVIQMYVKPDNQQVSLLLRVPLEAMRDVRVPLRGPGYINIEEAEQSLRDATQIWLANFISLYADDSLLEQWSIDAVRVSLPSNTAFTEYEKAYEHISAPPLPANTDLYRDQALLDVRITYPLAAPASEFSIDPDLGRLGLRTTTVLRFLPGEGVQRVFELQGSPGVIPLEPSWHHAFLRFVKQGVGHILDGTDHLLFVICLIIPFRRLRPVIVIVTSFTVAHSITLVASAFSLLPNALWFPPLIETLIAASIVYMAFENIVGSRWERRWMIAFGFGLVHGFGFAFALRESLQFAGSHLLTSLLAFNIGVEIGQLLIIVVAIPALNFLFRTAITERMGTILFSALLAHSGWHWMSDRATVLSAYQFTMPAMNAAFLASVMRWVMLLLIIGVTLWFLYNLYRRFLGGVERSPLQKTQ